ncbi:MAG: hypothetical protein ACOY4F_11040 [Thermodesulfobacteriota bacterium]
MKKYRVYFATKVHVFTRWFRRKERVSATDYVVVSGHNEAHAVKEAKKYINFEELDIPLRIIRICEADDDEADGYCHQDGTPRDQ